MTDDKKRKYPYELADGLIHEIYKKEFSNGEYQIEMVDAGELHFLLGKFWEKISPDVEKLQEKVEKLREALDLIADGSEDIWEMYPEDCEGKAVMDFAKQALKKE